MQELTRNVGPRYWPLWLLLGMQRLLLYLPLPVVTAIGRGFGSMLLRAGGKRRRVALRNLERCLPELDEARRMDLLAENFRLLGQALLVMPLPWWASRRRLDRLVRLVNGRFLDEALAAGRSVILLTPHFMGLEITIAMSRQRPMMYMYQKLRNPLMNAVMLRGRSHFGGQLVERSAPLRGMVKQLKNGIPMVYLPDQNPGLRRGIFVPFFGIRTATHPALSRIAAMTDAVVIPCLCRLQPGSFEIELRPPLQGFPTGDEERDTTLMNAMIEKVIRETPEQYFWVHQRFKLRPQGEPDFYD